MGEIPRIGWDQEDGYDIAQICVNGHVAISSAGRQPECRQDSCTRCGAETVWACAKCDDSIRGDYLGVASFSYNKPSYCHRCGEPYPWRASAIQAALHLVREVEGLTEEDRETLASSIIDLMNDTPRTELSAMRFKRSLRTAGQSGVRLLMAMAKKSFTERAIELITSGHRKDADAEE